MVAGVIADLVRIRVQRDLRATRARAARVLVDHVDGNVSEAHRLLSAERTVSRRTLDDLLDL